MSSGMDAESHTDGARCGWVGNRGKVGMVSSPLAFCTLLSPSQEPEFFLLTVLTLEVVFTVEHSSIQSRYGS